MEGLGECIIAYCTPAVSLYKHGGRVRKRWIRDKAMRFKRDNPGLLISEVWKK